MTPYLSAAAIKAAAVNAIAEWVITSLVGAVLLLMLIRGLMNERAHRRRIRQYEEARKRRAQVIDVSSPRWESTWRAFADLDADLAGPPETPQQQGDRP